MRAPAERVFRAAQDVERWPEILPHYRRVRFLERRPGGGLRLRTDAAPGLGGAVAREAVRGAA